MAKVTVNLPNTQYDVLIEPGLLANVGPLVANQWSARKVALISDSNVAPLYANQVQTQLRDAGFDVKTYVVPAGEASKSWPRAAEIVAQMAQDRFTRSDGVIALGGGVVGDLAGFVASTYMRGLSFIQVPTSLLAQVDSSVGGKTAIDLGETKNIIGTFYQPDLVVIDPETLVTLSDRYLTEGYAEIVKTAALDSLTFWHLIEQINTIDDIRQHAPQLSQMSIRYKAQVVMADVHEAGERQHLNFGHTLGHAIELLAHGQLAHGEAVSVGMVQLMKCFEAHGLVDQLLSERLSGRLAVVGLPTDSELLGTEAFYNKIQNDKKNQGGHLNLVYLSAIGQPAIHTIGSDQIRQFLQPTLKERV